MKQEEKTNVPFKTYLALGDSYTIGESVKEEERYPMVLVDKLREKDINLASPHIIARTGWTTDELMSAIKSQNLPDTYGLVSLLIGVNNQYRNYQIATYRQEFEELLGIAIRKAGGNTQRVFVVSIPDYGVTPFAQNSNKTKIAQEIDNYNNIAQEICLKYQVKYFDITPISRKATQDLNLIASDALHPSGKIYQEWVNLMLNEVMKMLA